MRALAPPDRPGDPFVRGVAIVVAITAAIGVAVELLAAAWPGTPPELVGLLSLSYESNLPTWLASGLLLLCALELGAIAARAPTWRRHWWGLAIGFAVMSADEVIGGHELLSEVWSGDGVLYFGWVVPAIALVLLLAAAYLPFLLRLPAAQRRRFVLAGAVYLSGAVVLELPLGAIAERLGDDGLAYAMLDAIEETLELAGATLFLAALRRSPR